MSLSQFLEPIEPPPSGIVDVRRRAQRRSRSARLAVLGGSIVPALLVFVLGVTFSSANHNRSLSGGNETAISGPIVPDATGLPGGSVTDGALPNLLTRAEIVDGIAFYLMVAGVLLVVAGNVWSLVANRRDAIPLLWPTGKRRFVIVLGLIVVIVAAAMNWFAG